MDANPLTLLETLLPALPALRMGVLGDPGSLPGGDGGVLPGACGVAVGLSALGVVDVRLFTRLETGPAGEQQATLLDRGVHLTSGPSESLLAALEAALPQIDALLVCDEEQGGVVDSALLDALTGFAQFTPSMRFFARSRNRIGSFRGMVRLPDQRQAAGWLFPERDPGQVDLEAFAAAALHPQVDCGCPLVIRLGHRGSLVIDDGESHLIRSQAAYEETPLAAEAYFAAFAAALTAGAGAPEAALFAQLAAAAAGEPSAAGKPLMGLPTPREIRALFAGGAQ